MLSKRLAVAAALGLALGLASTANASDDVLRLTLPNTSADALTPGALDDLDHDTIAAGYRWGGYRGWGWGWSGYRSWGWSGYRSWGWRPHWGYTSWGWGWRPHWGYSSWGWGGHRGWGWGGYRGWGGRGFYFGFRISDTDGGADLYALCGRRVARSTPLVYSYTVPAQPYVVPAEPRPGVQVLPAPSLVPSTPNESDGTFEYDGGPKAPVPMPLPDEQPRDKPTVIPYDKLYPGETLVSAPAEKKTGKWKYPAYGERPTRSAR